MDQRRIVTIAAAAVISAAGACALAWAADAAESVDAQARAHIERLTEKGGLTKLSLGTLAVEFMQADLRQNAAMLEQCRRLRGLTRFEGFELAENGDVLLLGAADPALPELDIEFLALVLQSAWQGRSPTCSIDPIPGNAAEQEVRLKDVPEKSRFATVMTAADYGMKAAAMGVACPATEKVKIKPWLDRMLERPAAATGAQANRWWFVFDSSRARTLVLRNGSLYLLTANPVVLRTETQVAAKFGTGAKAPEAEQFAQDFTEALPKLGEVDRATGRLLALYRLLDLAEHIRVVRKGAALPAAKFWLGYQSNYQGPPKRVATLQLTKNFPQGNGQMQVSVAGGVEMQVRVDVKSFHHLDGDIARLFE